MRLSPPRRYTSKTAAARDHHANPIAVAVEEPLEELLPAGELVQLVKEHQRRFGAKPVQAERTGDLPRPRQHPLAVVQVVPVHIGVCTLAARGGLAHLPRAAHERHLAVADEVLPKHLIVKSWPVKPWRDHSADYYLAYRGIVKTVLRCMRF